MPGVFSGNPGIQNKSGECSKHSPLIKTGTEALAGASISSSLSTLNYEKF